MKTTFIEESACFF